MTIIRKSSYQYHYKKWHKDDSEHRMAMKISYKTLFEDVLRNVSRGPAMDMGCGMGFMVEFLQEEGFNPTFGYDCDEEQIQICINHYLRVIKTNNADVAFQQADTSFALITAIDFLEHLSPDLALQTIQSVYATLKEGGVLICTVPNANSALAGRWRYIDYTHCTSFTEHSLDYLLYSAGFTDITILPSEIPRGFSVWNPKSFAGWVAYKMIRGFRRCEMITELGAEGKKVPLSLNLLGVAKKK